MERAEKMDKVISLKDANKWYEKERHIYLGLVRYARPLIKNLLRASDVPFVDVYARCKTLDSYADKIRKKNYSDPVNDVTDLAGFRVVALVETDTHKIVEALKKSLKIHDELSLDKSTSLGHDKFGYRSIHLICDLGIARTAFPESIAYKDIKFEIQVRTSLQHAWAEIEHDRGYKLDGDLPSHLKRRFNLLAALLEMADRDFDRLTEDIEAYQEKLSKKFKRGDLKEELNSTSVLEFLKTAFSSRLVMKALTQNRKNPVIQELKIFGVKTISDLATLFSEEFMRSLGPEHPIHANGILRVAMIIKDMDKYFSQCWQNHWRVIDKSGYELISAKYGLVATNKIFDELNITVRHDKDFQTFREPRSN